jgi:hypothetical protein
MDAIGRLAASIDAVEAAENGLPRSFVMPRAAASVKSPSDTGKIAVNLHDHSATKGRSNLMEVPPNEAGTFFLNCRNIGLARERRDGDGQQLVGGGLRICHCCLALCHGNRLVHTSSQSSRRCRAGQDVGGVHQKSSGGFRYP